MKNYQKLFIGITAICLFAVLTVSADAAIPKKAVTKLATKAKDYITKVGNSLGNTIWQNKGSVAIGASAVAVATHPEPFVNGAVSILTGKPVSTFNPSATGNSSMVGSLWYYPFDAAVTLLCVIGVRYTWNYVKDYKNWLPVLVIGVCFISSGAVEAGVVQNLPMAEGIASVIPKPPMLPPVPWWTIINVIVVAITIFI
jgi:hypothetical protein